MSTSITRKAVQGLAAGIGLVSEANSARKLKKQQQSLKLVGAEEMPRCNDIPTRSAESSIPVEGKAVTSNIDALEEHWALDEAQEELTHISSNPKEQKEKDSAEKAGQGDLAQRFISKYSTELPPAYSHHASRPQLSAPVVLPQRRPRNRDRGFIRAYAPTLANCGIDEAMFMDFLNTAEKACQANPWLNAINLASIGTMWMPTVTGIAVSIAIELTTEVAIAADGRRKTNTFFDKVNKEFFRPRGLYCLVMTWNPELPDAPSTSIDINSLVSKASNSGGSQDTFGRLRHRFKSSDGKAYGNIFPEIAPLVSPHIEELASDENAGKKISKMKQRKEFVSGFMDKRAQAKFASENPNSHLIQGPKPVFTSRYADPNHPASSGDFLGLITAGRFTMDDLPRRQTPQYDSRGYSQSESQDSYQRRNNSRSNAPAPPAPHGRSFGLSDAIGTIRERRTPSNTARTPTRDFPRDPYYGNDYYSSQSPQREGRPEKEKESTNPLSKLLKKRVLYLAIVNMPSDDEIRHAQNALGHGHAGYQNVAPGPYPQPPGYYYGNQY